MPKKVDTNQREIVTALRTAGATVFSLASLGKGVPDLCIGFRGLTILLEIKGPKGKVNPAQAEWHARWGGSPVVVIRSVDDILPLIKNMAAMVSVFGNRIAAAAAGKDTQ